MAPPAGTWTGITQQQRNFYSLLLLKRLRPFLVMLGEGRNESVGKRMGKTIEWRVMDAFTRATTPLTEGVVPTVMAQTWQKITCTVNQYGAWTSLSDIFTHQSIDPVWTETTENLGEHAGQSLHAVLINILAAGTNIRYADAVAARINIAAANVLDAAEIRRARRLLAAGNVPGYDSKRGSGYHALVHPATMEYLTSDATIMSIAQYTGGVSKDEGVDLLDGQVLKFGGFRFRESTDAPVFTGLGAGGIDAYGSFFYGPDWFGETTLAVRNYGTVNGETNKLSGVEIMAVPVDVASKDDPLGQMGTCGWKAFLGAAILQQARGLRIEHSAI